jgi:hypothetical protein
VPILIANLAAAHNGTDVIAFAAPKKIAGRRRTPESVRFLGRRVYAGLVVVLITVMIHGLKRAVRGLPVGNGTWQTGSLPRVSLSAQDRLHLVARCQLKCFGLSSATVSCREFLEIRQTPDRSPATTWQSVGS